MLVAMVNPEQIFAVFRAMLLRSFKRILILIGTHLSDRQLTSLQAMLRYVMVGRWMAKQGFRFKQRVKYRTEVWQNVLECVGDKRVLYLEFGVYRGDSIRFWARGLKHPDTKLHGFDSFEGLPESGGPWMAGEFDTNGQIPVVDDPRVRFFKGWFDKSLADYAVPPHDQLVINLDADLYSSTIFVLRSLRPHIKVGTYIYFDEFCVFEHELRAFQEFMNESGLKFKSVCADQTLTFVCFQCVG